MHGAAYGNGIYLSPHASVSFGYSGMGYNRGGTNQKSSVSSIKSVCENSYLPSPNVCVGSSLASALIYVYSILFVGRS